MNKSLFVALSLVITLLSGCAMPPQQQYAQPQPQQTAATTYVGGDMMRTVPSVCNIDGKPELQNLKGLSEAQCAEVARLSGTTSSVSSGNSKVASKLTFSNEGTGNGICRLLSNGTARLKANPSQVTVQGQVLATSQKTPDAAVVLPLATGEDCAVWRRRIAPQILWMG